jgi:hypothetical protein
MPQHVIKAIDTLSQAARLITPIGVVALLALQSQFVTRGEFASTTARIQKIEEVLIRMEVQSVTDIRHDNILSDHEARIRNIEKTK